MKRFVTPQVAAAFDYVYAVDEDSSPEEMNVPEFIQILKKHNISVAQPALSKNSSVINHPVTAQRR